MPRTRVPPKIAASVRAICRALPEVIEEEAWAGTRWMIRKKNFAHVVQIDGGWPPVYAREAGSDGPLTVLTFRAAGLLYDTLRTTGAPYFQPAWGTRWGTKVIGMRLGARVDWEEVAVLLAESYRLLAPARLAASLAAAAESESAAVSSRRAPPRRAPSRRVPSLAAKAKAKAKAKRR